MFLSKVLQAGIQSGSIMTVADIVTQIGIERKSFEELHSSKQNVYDPHRTLRWAVAGLTLHGPYFFVGFSKVDAYFGAATSLSTVIKKTAAAQFVLFPPYLCLLFSYMGLMEGHATRTISQKVRERVPEAFVGGCVFWPFANGINFALIPSSLRVPYLASSAGMWNCYLSWANARGQGP